MVFFTRNIIKNFCFTRTYSSLAPLVELSNGKKIPILGLGTWKSVPKQAATAVKHAIDVGYRHIDCAFVYENECDIGNALAEKFREGIIRRDDVFITSKLWNTFHKPDLVESAIKITLANLHLNYLDLYLMHWPMAYNEGYKLFPTDSLGNIIHSNVDYVNTWREMEKLVITGLTKSLGVCNFNMQQIDRLIRHSTIKPVVNQIECHPYLTQKKLIAHCTSKGVKIIACAPLGSPDRPWAKQSELKLLDDPLINELANKYRKTVAQILIRYQIENGSITIPKSSNKVRIEQNFNVFNFEFKKEDLFKIESLRKLERYIHLSELKTHKYYPFK